MEVCKKVLSKYSKYVIHMRQQYYSQPQHMGFVLGAGVSMGLGFPGWGELVNRISNSDEMQEFKFDFSAERDVISASQKLYQLYKAKKLQECSECDKEYNRIEMIVRANWQRIVHKALYADICNNVEEMVHENHYLWDFIEVFKKLPMVVNYNFDDTIQRMLASRRTDEEKDRTRGYTTVWNSNIYMYPQKSVVYHPNGFLPFSLSEHPSEKLVFLEDSFADQLIESVNGNYTALTSYFTNNTCLLIGLSLSDPTLKHILRNNSINYPGNYHYYVHYVRENEVVENEKAIIDANFDVYNLITMFMSDSDLKALGRLIRMSDEDFESLLEELGLVSSYKYMIIGSVAVGKSTALSHFRSLYVHDEWLEHMPKEMTKDPSKVDENNINLIDKWVAEQWGKKNYRLLRSREGINLIDRGPLDAFVFTPRGEWKNKAELTRLGISPGKANRELCPTKVIHLVGDPETMASRAIASHRDTNAEKLKRQQLLLEYVYQFEDGGTTRIDTRNKGKTQVAKEIARCIFLEDYQEAPLDRRLLEIELGEFLEPGHLLMLDEECISESSEGIVVKELS